MRKSILLTCSFFLTTAALAQDYSETGSQAITNFSPKEYGQNPQNWAITQDKNGILYFGNEAGLVEFDGSAWRFHQLPNKGIVRCFANGDDGKIYLGAQGDLGYFVTDAAGRLSFQSLMNFVPENRRIFPGCGMST